jgi:plasmid maintenance system killer protein
MEVQFSDELYDRLEIEPKFFGGFPYALVTIYRKRLQQIRCAHDERDLCALKSLGIEKINAETNDRFSIRLTNPYLLVVEVSSIKKTIKIISIENHH